MAKHHLTAVHKYRLLKSLLRMISTLLVVLLTLWVKSDSEALSKKVRLSDFSSSETQCLVPGSLKSTKLRFARI